MQNLSRFADLDVPVSSARVSAATEQGTHDGLWEEHGWSLGWRPVALVVGTILGLSLVAYIIG